LHVFLSLARLLLFKGSPVPDYFLAFAAFYSSVGLQTFQVSQEDFTVELKTTNAMVIGTDTSINEVLAHFFQLSDCPFVCSLLALFLACAITVLITVIVFVFLGGAGLVAMSGLGLGRVCRCYSCIVIIFPIINIVGGI